ncbi:MAG: glycoside hydrolase family 25 protein [Oscillospiraceae bacterium]|nr:glycoside hydrolase family 25 protein [Oscillospiraceae bacterium]
MKKTAKKTILFLLLICAMLTYLPIISAASAAEWDGKAPLEQGSSYIISSEVWLRENATIPEGAVVTITDGGSLLLSREMKLTVRGTLIIRPGGTLEIRKAEINIRGTGLIVASGKVLHYMENTVNVISGSLNIRDDGEYICSGDLLVYADGEVVTAGKLTLTPNNQTIVTGAVEIAKGGILEAAGTFTVTPSGRVINNGLFTIYRDGELTNSGIFTINEGADLKKFGTHRNTLGSVFIDRNRYDALGRRIQPEKMTAALLTDEPRVELLGIDVSHWQYSIDWERVAASGVEFAIIRAARGFHSAEFPMIEDVRFRENIEGALENNIDVGVYFYSYARSVEEAKKEAEFYVSVIQGYELTYPVVFDIEEPYHEKMSADLITAITEAFFDVLIENGYYPMLYSNKNFLVNVFDERIPGTYAVWLAQWTAAPTYEGEFQIWQYTAKGRVPGINGDVDLNISYIDFPEVLRRHKLNRL